MTVGAPPAQGYVSQISSSKSSLHDTALDRFQRHPVYRFFRIVVYHLFYLSFCVSDQQGRSHFGELELSLRRVALHMQLLVLVEGVRDVSVFKEVGLTVVMGKHHS